MMAAGRAGRDGGAVIERVLDFGRNEGGLEMYRHVPRTLKRPAPLVVALHGCTQSAAAYDDEPGWTALADRLGFALLLPQQTLANNPKLCFNWFRASDTRRDSGEAYSVKQMIDRMVAELPIDRNRIFVTGLSAGGAMAAALLAVYPDVFAGGGIVAGVPYRAAVWEWEAAAVMSEGRPGRSAREWGDLVRRATRHAGPWPRVSIWHGLRDDKVSRVNATALTQQWTDVHGIDASADSVERLRRPPNDITRRVYRDRHGTPQVESWLITRLGHALPVDPGTGADQGGQTDAYVVDANIWAGYYMARFWGLVQDDPALIREVEGAASALPAEPVG